MSFLTGAPKNSWQPAMTVDTTTSNYWLNWRVTLCSIWILASMVFASILITKYEGPSGIRNRRREQEKDSPGLLYEDEVWKPCLKTIHPGWLLGYRVVAFLILLLLLILNVAVDGGELFYYYTQWTFTLITIYFGLGSVLSMYGCYQYHNKVGGDGIGNERADAEYGSRRLTVNIESNSSTNAAKQVGENAEQSSRQIADFWGYVFQIIFQMNAGAVTLTDCVFWFILVPFLTIRGYNLNFWIINMHSINVVFLLGDTALNCLRFPWFRIGYFFLWTAVYVVFQWAVHACISIWWPYPFLDLSSSFSPLWYSSVAVMHIPCYGIFVLVMKLKHHLLKKWFPHSYQCAG
ncbi:uncharacterized protein LOC129896892 isoform X1 [Solanum dulcamara]|uniref:uncharacterized protein LOC129896892 isoform X1 n=2 Tax=Solanum dulcamara TaxID=45834 RepID=UPI002485FCC5|nr:uncharacterized protein LOC129896892 isoform X1 [Solanum dulcamara]